MKPSKLLSKPLQIGDGLRSRDLAGRNRKALHRNKAAVMDGFQGLQELREIQRTAAGISVTVPVSRMGAVGGAMSAVDLEYWNGYIRHTSVLMPPAVTGGAGPG